MLMLVSSPSEATPSYAVKPWTEAVVSVRNPQQVARLFIEEGQWRVTTVGRLSRAELTYWRLPATTGGRFMRICPPGPKAPTSSGCLRLVSFEGVAQRPIRLAARPWDVGGIYSIMVRSNNVQALFDRAISLGWWAESEPIAFSFGGSRLKNVVLQGPDGFQLAVYERSSPPFTSFPVSAISQAFNAMRMVRDERASVAFYRDKLGFSQVFDSDYRDPAPQQSNFSLPQNLTTTVIRRASAMQPTPGETGRIEVMQFVGLVGKDAGGYARAPNLGILSVRYPVVNLGAYKLRLAALGVRPVQAARAVPIPELGEVDLMAVSDPDGNLTEFYEAGS